MTKAYYFDMDGVLANFHKAYATDRAIALKREAMANLEVFAENVALLNQLIAQGMTCYILTKAANEDGAQGKIDWLKKYVPMMDAEHTIIITKGRKVDFIREEGILIDDDEANIRQWIKGGHEALHLTIKGEAIAL